MNKFHYIILFFSACMGTLIAESEHSIKLDAEEVDYNGQEISLSGNVTVEHELGTVCAGEVNLETSKDPQKSKFSMLHMRKNVSVTFQDGGKLNCYEARINPQTLRGEFNGNNEEEVVIFQDSFGKKEETAIPLEVQSRNMKVALDRTDETSSLNKIYLKKIIATDAVLVEYNKELFVKADQGIYERSLLPEDQLQSFALPGLITLRGTNRPCFIWTAQEDKMITDEIQIDTVNRLLVLHSPKGVMQMQDKKIDFQANRLSWDERNDVLTLSDDVEIIQEGFGKLNTNKQVQLKRHMQDGKKTITSIESCGTTVMTFQQIEKNLQYILTCPGNVLLDHQATKTIMNGLPDQDGIIADEGQIHFQDAVGEVYADWASIDYSMSPIITPQKIVLKGNVRIYNHADAQQAQYALADVVEFTLENKEMIFAANGKNRVLFFDRINHLQVSAPKLRLRREGGSKKESIKGYGDVRFSFVEKEFDQLRKRFRFNDGA